MQAGINLKFMSCRALAEMKLQKIVGWQLQILKRLNSYLAEPLQELIKFYFYFRIAVFSRRFDAANVCLIFNGNNLPGFKGPGYHIQVNLP